MEEADKRALIKRNVKKNRLIIIQLVVNLWNTLIYLDDLGEDVIERFDIQDAVVEENEIKIIGFQSEINKIKDTLLMSVNRMQTDLNTTLEEVTYMFKINKRERLDVEASIKLMKDLSLQLIKQFDDVKMKFKILKNDEMLNILIEDMKIRLATEAQDHLDRQNICIDKIFGQKLEENFVIKALNLSLQEYKDSKVKYEGREWERNDLIEMRMKQLQNLGIDISGYLPSSTKRNKDLIYQINKATKCAKKSGLNSSISSQRNSSIHNYLNNSYDADETTRSKEEGKSAALHNPQRNLTLSKQLKMPSLRNSIDSNSKRRNLKNALSLKGDTFSPIPRERSEFP